MSIRDDVGNVAGIHRGWVAGPSRKLEGEVPQKLSEHRGVHAARRGRAVGLGLRTQLERAPQCRQGLRRQTVLGSSPCRESERTLGCFQDRAAHTTANTSRCIRIRRQLIVREPALHRGRIEIAVRLCREREALTYQVGQALSRALVSTCKLSCALHPGRLCTTLLLTSDDE